MKFFIWKEINSKYMNYKFKIQYPNYHLLIFLRIRWKWGQRWSGRGRRVRRDGHRAAKLQWQKGQPTPDSRAIWYSIFRLMYILRMIKRKLPWHECSNILSGILVSNNHCIACETRGTLKIDRNLPVSNSA